MSRAEILRENISPFADAVILTDTLSQYYISGFRYTDGYVVITGRGAYLITDFRYDEAARIVAGDNFEVIVPKNGMLEEIKEILQNDGVKTCAFEENQLAYADYENLCRKLNGISLVPSNGVLRMMRRKKDRSEIDKIIAAQKITDAAFDHILKTLTPQMTECDVAVELEYFMRKNGAEEKSFDTIAVSGSASSMPHGVPRPIKLERGFLTMDYGCCIDGYHSDMTRTVVLGRADSEMKRLYNTVLFAQTQAIERAEVGMKCAEIDAIARDIIDGAGYANCFGHSLGHSVGLEIHETPGFSAKSPDLFENGNVITVEPGIYIAGKYGCRIEDMIYAFDGRVTNITNSSKELIELF